MLSINRKGSRLLLWELDILKRRLWFSVLAKWCAREQRASKIARRRLASTQSSLKRLETKMCGSPILWFRTLWPPTTSNSRLNSNRCWISHSNRRLMWDTTLRFSPALFSKWPIQKWFSSFSRVVRLCWQARNTDRRSMRLTPKFCPFYLNIEIRRHETEKKKWESFVVFSLSNSCQKLEKLTKYNSNWDPLNTKFFL